MEYQTWTRKANAVAAVGKLLEAMTIHDDIMITGVEAVDEGTGYSATVHVEFPRGATIANDEFPRGATIANDEFRAFVQELEPKARVSATFPEPTARDEEKPAPKSRGRKSEFHGVAIYAEMDNPYRANTLSWKAYDVVQRNPGITLEEFRAKGGQDRTLRHEKRLGRITTKPLP